MKVIKRFATGATPRIEILPLIDVVFLVLIAFIYASMFMTQKMGLSINLPQSFKAKAEMSEVVTLTITQEGELYLDQQRVQFANLEAVLSSAKVAKPDAGLFVIADRDARLDPLVKVMDIARKIGMNGLTIATDKKVNVAQETGG